MAEGIKFVIGRLKGEKNTTVQTVIFSKDEGWTEEKAKVWLKNNDMYSGKVDETDNYFRYRQKNPDDFEENSFRTIIPGKKKMSEYFYYLTDISDLKLEEKDNKKTAWIEIFRIGKWNHPKYGIIEGTKKLFNDFINNWKNNILGREISFDKTHNPEEGATGWVKELKIEDDKLKAFVEFTPWGVELIEQKGFKYFSPEYRSEYIDKETGVIYNNVLMGGAITNRPFLTNLAPVVLSEDFEKGFSLCCPSVIECPNEDKYRWLKQNFISILNELVSLNKISIEEIKDFIMPYLQNIEEYTMSEDLKEELFKYLEEYVEKNEEKIKNIMSSMKEHMQEMIDEINKENGMNMMKNIIKRHMNSMMHDMIDSLSMK